LVGYGLTEHDLTARPLIDLVELLENTIRKNIGELGSLGVPEGQSSHLCAPREFDSQPPLTEGQPTRWPLVAEVVPMEVVAVRERASLGEDGAESLRIGRDDPPQRVVEGRWTVWESHGSKMHMKC
jgi:hypothetical protein